MLFDEDISSDISLSKILDAFILENESTSAVIAFLHQHQQELSSILKYSIYGTRIFQLDFFLCCSINDQHTLLDMLLTYDINLYAYLSWQILKSAYGNVQHIKHQVKCSLQNVLCNSNIRHPYRFGSNGGNIRTFDDYILKHSSYNDIADIATQCNELKLDAYFKYLDKSLFVNRILQYDFFSNLDVASKWIFIREVYENDQMPEKTLIDFTLQVLDSNEDDHVKMLICTKVKALSLNILNDDILELMSNCASFSELMLKLTILGRNISQYVVLHLLTFNFKYIKDWYDYDVEGLNKTLNVGNLIALMMSKK